MEILPPFTLDQVRANAETYREHADAIELGNAPGTANDVQLFHQVANGLEAIVLMRQGYVDPENHRAYETADAAVRALLGEGKIDIRGNIR